MARHYRRRRPPRPETQTVTVQPLASGPTEGDFSRRRLATDECAQVLREIGWGVLAVTERTGGVAVPIGVPTAYAYDDGRLYLAMTDGRKLRALLWNPNLCLTVADVRSLDAWRSVTVIGRARWLSEGPTHTVAIAAFLAQPRRRGWRAKPEDVRRLLRSRILTLEVAELHGYAGIERVPPPTVGEGDPRLEPASLSNPSAEPTDAAAEAMDMLRRVVRALRTADGESEAALGLTSAQLFVLREIDKARTLSVGELARRTATAQSSVSEVITRLAARGLINRGRSVADRRRAEIALSEAGHALLTQSPETVQERLLAAFGRLPVDLQCQAADGLRAWISAAGLSHLPATMFFEPLLNA
jgi:DNA-binding MarR family transcriptional regulator/nitroimidazol reductase NimA-like FMN-containing flavoprotein (pyridoxamine 5'-phosphate oxidase superfamily)